MHATTTFLADCNGLTPSGEALLERLRATPGESKHRSCSLAGGRLPMGRQGWRDGANSRGVAEHEKQEDRRHG